jgi:hypothetical protein
VAERDAREVGGAWAGFQDLNGAALVRGVARGFVVRTLEERGRVFGVAFRPGCFRPFLGRPVSEITDQTVPARDIFGPRLPADATRESVDAFLLAHLPAPDPMTRTSVTPTRPT